MTDNDILAEAIQLVHEGIAVTLPVNGWSMLPFIIGGKEKVILQQPDNVQCGDIVLAWVEGSRYVVHRIIRIDGDRVTLMGDGNIAGTEHCLLKDVQARATHVVNEKGTHDLYTPWRKKAARLWGRLLPVRRYILAIYRRL